MTINKETIYSRLQEIIIPEVNKPVTSYLQNLEVSDKDIKIIVGIDKKIMPLKNSLEKVITSVLEEVSRQGYKIDLHITGNESSSRSSSTSASGSPTSPLSSVKNIIAVGSGKGGVGKSTVSANLAISLAKTGAKVGLLDADVYGPSIPTMFGVTLDTPLVNKVGNKDMIIPLEKYGIKLISIGLFVKEDDALIWRGAMATGALKQLINDVDWGELDYFIIDLPPGTGDVPLTMVQTLPLTGAIIVTTPQQIAVSDVIKSINMFKSNKIEVPVLGIIENMSWFTPADAQDKKYYIFGQGGGQRLSKKFNIPLLGQIPVVEKITTDADLGLPISLDTSSTISKSFMELADNTITRVEHRNKNLPPTNILRIN